VSLAEDLWLRRGKFFSNLYESIEEEKTIRDEI
jgi:hypothetical protein